MDILKKVEEEVRKGRPFWIFLDYDGTLEEFAATPEDVRPDEALVELLGKLAQKRDQLRVVVLSGRPLEQLQQLLPVKGILLAGTYGIEYQDFKGKIVRLRDPGPLRGVIEELKGEWQKLARGKKGFFIEDKGAALALHSKNAAPEEAERITDRARELAREAAGKGPFYLIDSPNFLEIAPMTANKAYAVTALLGLFPSENVGLLYFGDDRRDEEAFPVVNARNGVTVVVGKEHRSAALARIESPAEVRAWLARLAEIVPDADRKDKKR